MFGKLLPYFLALVVIEIIVILILIVWIFNDAGFLASIYNFIGNSSIAFDFFNFIADWAEAISGVVVLGALVIVFISFKKFQRSRSVNRLHNWARNGVVLLAQYRQASPGEDDSAAERYAEATVLLDKLMATSSMALSDARNLGGEINARTIRTVDEVRAIKVKLAKEDESLFEDLPALQHDFADVMIIAFEFIK